MTELALNVPKQFRRGGRKEQELVSVESGRELIELMCAKVGIADLGDTELLDVGCGNKFVQAILTYDVDRTNSMIELEALRAELTNLLAN